MNHEKVRRFQGERGATLILAIAFMVVVGVISGAVLATTTSGLQNRVALDQARDREYAADGAIEQAVAGARAGSGMCPASSSFTLNGITIHVDCTSAAAVVNGAGDVPALQNNLSMVACVGASPCGAPNAPPIINAQINFQGTAPTVTTFVQAWSVNG